MGKEPRLPKGEIVWVDYRNSQGQTMFIMTSKEARDCYFLYEVKGDSYVKLGKGKEPPDLVTKFNVMERIRA